MDCLFTFIDKAQTKQRLPGRFNRGKIMVMVKTDQRGEVSGLAIGLVITILLLILAVVAAGWGISGRQDYKNNVDAKINVAVNNAVKAEDQKKDAQFAEEYKKPLASWSGPEDYGSIQMSYPKTWSGYVDTKGQGNTAVDLYFAPKVVPTFNDPASIYALRVQVVNQSYADSVGRLDRAIRAGTIKVSAYSLPKLPKVVGVRVQGKINSTTPVDQVILPLRSQSILIWTEGGNYVNDFNNYILPNFSFSP